MSYKATDIQMGPIHRAFSLGLDNQKFCIHETLCYKEFLVFPYNSNYVLPIHTHILNSIHIISSGHYRPTQSVSGNYFTFFNRKQNHTRTARVCVSFLPDWWGICFPYFIPRSAEGKLWLEKSKGKKKLPN